MTKWVKDAAEDLGARVDSARDAAKEAGRDIERAVRNAADGITDEIEERTKRPVAPGAMRVVLWVVAVVVAILGLGWLLG